jgi:DNA invertase Pin-like site-specific DNA recombinase
MPRAPLDDEEEIDLTTLSYALYVRRSTEDKNKQVRSLGDQIKECRKFAKDNDLHIIGEPLKEKKSAKRAGQRKVFDQMLLDIRNKKYDAILSWAPDRLSRNMLEGGVLINMLDEGELKDLRFVSHHFTNDASGKLTLGIMFSISKHFSDALSRRVTVGNKGNFSEGKSNGSPKWGYDRDDTTGLYTPNKFFELVQEAWYRRADGDTYEGVTKFLLEKGYHRVTKDKKVKRTIKPTKNAVGKMFGDPFYYGILVQANQTIDLKTVYDFEPMIDQEIYDQVQLLGYGRTKDKKDKKRVTFYPLHGFVYCAVCDDSKYMMVGKNKSRDGTHKLTYRCDNPNCTRLVKSFRAGHVFNSIADMLGKIELTDEAYERYSKQIDTMTGAKIVTLKEEMQSLNGVLNHIKRELKDRSLAVPSLERGSVIRKTNEERIDELVREQADLETSIKVRSVKIIDPSQIMVSKEEFLNTFKSAPDKIRAGSAIEKDRVCRILFLNLRVDNEKVTSYLWREPFRSLVTFIENSDGARERT